MFHYWNHPALASRNYRKRPVQVGYSVWSRLGRNVCHLSASYWLRLNFSKVIFGARIAYRMGRSGSILAIVNTLGMACLDWNFQTRTRSDELDNESVLGLKISILI